MIAAPAAPASLAHLSTAEIAKRLRVELKAAFPGTTFSVRQDRASQMMAVDVFYTDGPALTAVEAVLAPYSDPTDRIQFVSAHRSITADGAAKVLALTGETVATLSDGRAGELRALDLRGAA
jgi:hypothetical protein